MTHLKILLQFLHFPRGASTNNRQEVLAEQGTEN